MTSNFDQDDHLADKNPSITGIITFFCPPLGYVYTSRYQALITTFGIFCGTIFLCLVSKPSLQRQEDFLQKMMWFYGAGAAIENVRAVKRSQKAIKPKNPPQLQPDYSKIQILKLAKQQGEVTLADCVLEIKQAPSDVRLLLEELQREGLMEIDNRERDGAVIYRII
ncbi:MAG: hypothetical protein ACFBSC_10820 [Microcoleaceae cyanobacterium]